VAAVQLAIVDSWGSGRWSDVDPALRAPAAAR